MVRDFVTVFATEKFSVTLNKTVKYLVSYPALHQEKEEEKKEGEEGEK